MSPDTPGFVLRPVDATQQLPGAALPLPLAFDYVSDPFLRVTDCFCSMCCDSGVGWPYDIAGAYDAECSGFDPGSLTYDGAVFGSDSLSVGDVSSSCAVVH